MEELEKNILHSTANEGPANSKGTFSVDFATSSGRGYPTCGIDLSPGSNSTTQQMMSIRPSENSGKLITLKGRKKVG